MKRTYFAKSRVTAPDDMLSEYKFDYRKARPNRFAEKIYKDRRLIILDPDISRVFATAESVNTVLRALIATMPKAGKEKIARKPSQKALGKRI
jgi:hypothetical protein